MAGHKEIKDRKMTLSLFGKQLPEYWKIIS